MIKREEPNQKHSLCKGILNSLGCSICLLDEEGTIVEVNQGWLDFAEENNGHRGAIGPGINYIKICQQSQGESRENALRIVEGIQAVMQGEKNYVEVEYPCHSPAENRWFMARITPYTDCKDSNPRKTVIAHINITGRKQSERAVYEEKILELHKRDELLEKLSQQVPGTIYQYQAFPDGKSCFPFASYNIEEVYEVSPEEVKKDASKVIERLHKDDKERVVASIMESFATLKLWEMEYRVNLPRRGMRWLRGSARPEKQSDGSVIWHGYIRDITTLKEQEDSLQEIKELEKVQHIYESKIISAVPHVQGIHIETFYQPAWRMGGDLIHVLREGENLIFFLSDVTGHGMEGALFSTFVKEAIDSYVMLSPEHLTPGNILHHLYRQFCRENYPEDYFISIFIGILNLATLELTYSGAGFQEPILLCCKRQGEQILTCEGLPISNTVPEELMNFTHNSLTLNPDSTLFVYSDGLSEQEVQGTLFKEKVEQSFFSNSHRSPKGIKDQLNRDFYNFNEGSLQGEDDITYLIIQIQHDYLFSPEP